MTAVPILTVALPHEVDVVLARQRARRIADLLGFPTQDQTRIATAVSEIARNAATYGGGGKVEFGVERSKPARFVIRVQDEGPGIPALDTILAGRFRSPGGMGVGIVGARRLMDSCEIETQPGRGTTVTLGKLLPARTQVQPADLAEIGRQLAAGGLGDPMTEVRTQNQELLQSLQDLSAKQEEADRLNRELENTNRGVVALYAELDVKAAELQALNTTLEERVAAAVAECQHANDALRQSQKMEAVGQLTGGIAHDFNNLLQIVTGNLEIVGRNLPADAPRLRRAAENAMEGARRAATLTQRLLAFSRRQPLDPKAIDANRLVEGMSDLLRRTLGETIRIETRLANNLWSVEADANQLENALLNLAVNARDAMPDGGTLTITTANGIADDETPEGEATPGHFVSLAVADTGSGMSKETMAQVFEPFFTTKEVGKGTGLGLSMVYGFVKQSGGHVRLESAIGRGTAVTIYLPRMAGKAADAPELKEARLEPARPGEVILVVEDDGDVRAYSSDVLRELGYAVIEAQDGPSALQALQRPGRIDLMFTDVVLSGSMTGREVADAAAAIRPGLPILFTTGYARDTIVHNQRLDPGVELITKPFTFPALAARIRTLLD